MADGLNIAWMERMSRTLHYVEDHTVWQPVTLTIDTPQGPQTITARGEVTLPGYGVIVSYKVGSDVILGTETMGHLMRYTDYARTLEP